MRLSSRGVACKTRPMNNSRRIRITHQFVRFYRQIVPQPHPVRKSTRVGRIDAPTSMLAAAVARQLSSDQTARRFRSDLRANTPNRSSDHRHAAYAALCASPSRPPPPPTFPAVPAPKSRESRRACAAARAAFRLPKKPGQPVLPDRFPRYSCCAFSIVRRRGPCGPAAANDYGVAPARAVALTKGQSGQPADEIRRGANWKLFDQALRMRNGANAAETPFVDSARRAALTRDRR